MTIPVQEGRTLVLSQVVEGGAPPQVEVEVKLSPNGPPMRVAMLDPAEVLSAGAALRRLAMMSQQRAGDDDLFPASE